MVAYRETIKKDHTLWYTHKKQTGGSGQYAKVQIQFETNTGKGFEFVNAISGGAIPKEYIPSVSKGIQSAMSTGIKAGYPVVDVKATLLDGQTHPVDSSVLAFEIASRTAFREAAYMCEAMVLEPIMFVEIVTPEEYMGNIVGDLNSRRGMIQNVDTRDGLQVIQAHVPLARMFSYIADLRSLSKGRASYSMEFQQYDPLPESLVEELTGKNTAGAKK